MLAEDGVHCFPIECNGFACIGGGPTRLAPPPYVRACLMLVVSCSAAKSCNTPGPARVSCGTRYSTVTCIPGLRYIAGDLRSGPANFRFPAVFPVTRMLMLKSNANPHRSQTLSHGQRTSTAQRSSTAAVRTSGHLHTEARSFSSQSVHRGCPLQGAAMCVSSRQSPRNLRS